MLGGTVPGQSSAAGLALPLLAAIGKVAGFALVMFFVGRRAVPWLLEHVARVGSRELFTLAVLVSALGVGTIAAELFGVSFALGAFFAGAVISESELSQRAAADALPLQDAFAVLFFVSVGMLFEPQVVLQRPMQVLSLVAVIVVGKTAVAYGLMRLLRQSSRAAVMMGAALGQIGEFSFIVTALGVSMGLIPREGQALVVAAALIAITINGPVLSAAVRIAQRFADAAARQELAIEMESAPIDEPQVATTDPVAAVAASNPALRPTTSGSFARTMPPWRRTAGVAFNVPRISSEAPFDFSGMIDHVILIGHGRVGTTVAEALTRAGVAYVVVEERDRVVGGLRKRGELAVFGDATRADVLERAGIANARLLVVTAPEPIRARRIVEVARMANPRVAVAVRTHSATEQAFFEHYLSTPGAVGRAVYAEREAALSLAHFSLLAIGRTDDEADIVIDSLRGAPTRPTETFAALPTTEFEAFLRSSEAGRVRRRTTTTIPPTPRAEPAEGAAKPPAARAPDDPPPRAD
jgi:CPA2 family monovalent cation:H+ antiporter-2